MKTFRIGIIGTENSHAHGFTERINKPDENGNMRYPDCRVTLVYGHYPEESERVVREFGADAVANSIEEMVQNVDAVMITARDGKFHYEFVKPFIEAGIPAFVDKPFTVDPKEAEVLIALAKEKGVPLCGGSSLIFADSVETIKRDIANAGDDVIGGDVVAPVSMDNPYSGFFFYCSHLVEMTLEMFGYDPIRVSAVKNKHGVSAMVEYENYCVSNHFHENAYKYTTTVYKHEATDFYDIDISMIGAKECDDFVKMLRTGEMTRTYEQLIAPVYYMNAVKTAYETGKTVEIFSEKSR